MDRLLIALAGNPNSGKSTIFNALTGDTQRVGNWPGKTVDLSQGTFRANGRPVTIVDLPGAYSLTAYSPEEAIARDFIIEERPSLVVTVLDAANLERNLYLTVQVLEMGVPIIVALNMSDVAAARGISIDIDRLSRELHAPVIPTVASRGKGLSELKTAIGEALTAAEAEALV